MRGEGKAPSYSRGGWGLRAGRGGSFLFQTRRERKKGGANAGKFMRFKQGKESLCTWGGGGEGALQQFQRLTGKGGGEGKGP